MFSMPRVQPAMLTIVLSILLSPMSFAQPSDSDAPSNPVYLADAPVAIETIDRASSLSSQGNFIQAARSLDQLIQDQGDLFIPKIPESKIWITIRQRVQGLIQQDTDLLDAYRRVYSPKAKKLLDSGRWMEAGSRYWLTTSGGKGSLNHAQALIESARFTAGLRELDRLLTHPDANILSSRAYEVTNTAYRASPDQYARALLDQWRVINTNNQQGDDGAPPVYPEVFDIPPKTSRASSPLRWFPIETQSPAVQLDGLVSNPIASAILTPQPTSEQLIGSQDAPASGASIQPSPWTIPVVLGDTLVTNDGVTISSYDRFTLRPKWRLTTTSTDLEDKDRASTGVRSRIARTVEDLVSVSISDDGTIYAAAGLARTGGRTGDNRILAIDLESGEILHSKTLQEFDPDLDGSTVRGSVIIDHDTIVLAARKNLRRERLVALSLVGVNRHTFEHLWTRPIGSSGSLPFQQVGQISHSGVLDNGVLYWTDLMGLICAVQTATGEPLWARTMPPTDIYARYDRAPWTVSSPIVRDEHLYILSIDGTQIEQYNKRTGERTAGTRSMTTGHGSYLIETPEHLVCVGQSTITTHRFDQFGLIKPSLMTPTGDHRAVIRGRVMNTGSELIVPVLDGLSILDTLNTETRKQTTLSKTGNILALDGQVLVVDEGSVTSYLSWNIAQRLLNDRIQSSDDIYAAITLTDLALRSGHHDQAVRAIDHAVDLLKSDRIKMGSKADARDQLFDVLLDIIALPDTAHILENDSHAGFSEPVRTVLFDRSSRIAQSPEQQLRLRMTMGAWFAALDKIDRAVRVYHGVLQDPTLSSHMWQGTGLAIRADIEATNQLSRIVERHGRSECALFDDLARADYDALGADGSPMHFEQIARMYPWAPVGILAWTKAADYWYSDSKAPAAVRSAQAGFDSIERLASHGINPDQSTINTLGSILIAGLIDSQRFSQAAQTFIQLTETYPNLQLAIGDRSITSDTLSQWFTTKQSAPELGNRFVRTQTPVLITGSPLKPLRRSVFNSMAFYAPHLAMVRMVRIGTSEPELLWTRKNPGTAPPIVVEHNEFQTILLWAPDRSNPGSGLIESIQTNTGERLWITSALGKKLYSGSLREPDEVARIDGQFVSPSHGPVQSEQVLASTNGSLLVLVDRIGRGAGIDLLTGQVLWTGELPINRVHDIDLASGVLGIAGMWYVEHDPERNQILMRASRIVSIDARTGQTIQLLNAQTSTPRWIRVAPSGNLLVGTSQRILSVSTNSGTLDWVLRNESLLNTNAGWVLGNTLLVLDEFINLWPIDLKSGRPTDRPLHTAGKVLDRGWVNVRTHGDHLAVVGAGGVGIYTHNGSTIGIDAEQRNQSLINMSWGIDRLVLTGRTTSTDGKAMSIPLSIVDQRDAQTTDSINLTLPIEIQRLPVSIQAVDHAVIVGFGEVSVLLNTH